MTPAFAELIDRCQTVIGCFDAGDPSVALDRLRALHASTRPGALPGHERWRVQAVVSQMLARFAKDAGLDSAADVAREVVCTTAAMSADEVWHPAAGRCLAAMEFLVCARPSSLPKLKPTAPPCVRRALALVDEHYADRTLSLTSVGTQLDLTIWHLAHLLKKHVDESFTGILRTRRVIAAQRLLGHSSAPMKEITGRVGFASPSQFSKTFKAIAGLSPTAFRKRGHSPHPSR